MVKFVFKNSRQSVEIKPSITKYLKQNATDYHLTKENNLKVDKKVVISKTSKNLHRKKRLGTRI